MRKKCEKCDANAKCECNAKIVQCNTMSFYKKCECECDAKTFLHYHPYHASVGPVSIVTFTGLNPRM